MLRSWFKPRHALPSYPKLLSNTPPPHDPPRPAPALPHIFIHTSQLIDRLEAAEAFEAPAPPPAANSTNPVGRIASRILSRKFTRTRSVSVPPHELMCPITLQLFRDPVLLVGSGYTYEREAINEWLSRGSVKDPATGTVMLQFRCW